MKRAILDTILTWKSKERRKPLLIDGARQTGKTYLLKTLLGETFTNVVRVDFLESPEMSQAFDGSLSPKDIISNLELLTGVVFNSKTDLLILDEIGECPRALTSLKFFAESASYMYIAASGSNIGLLQSFPVGQVEQYTLAPLTFSEFLAASEELALIKAFNSQTRSAAAHAKLFDKLTDYYFTGGMPEAVSVWFNEKSSSIIQRIEAVSNVHQNLVLGYLRDFGKYSGKVDANLLEAVFTNVPSQLSSVLDESVNRFKFKGIVERKSRYRDFETAISWLEKSHLVLRNNPITGMPKSPLAAYCKDNMVKLFLFDVGLLNNMLGTSYKELKQQEYQYKGYIAENYVQQELFAQGLSPTFSWGEARAEIEFIVADKDGNIIPVEVKSGSRTRAKSLTSYIHKYKPLKTIKFVGSQGSDPLEKINLVYPLYYSEYVINRHFK